MGKDEVQTKSRSIVQKEGEGDRQVLFFNLTATSHGTTIPSITEQPVKSLGKLFDSSLKYTAAIQKANQELGAWVTKVLPEFHLAPNPVAPAHPHSPNDYRGIP